MTKKVLECPDITYVTPGKNNQMHIGKCNDEKVFKQRKNVLWTLNDLLGIASGAANGEKHWANSSLNRFAHKRTFCQFYNGIKSSSKYIYNSNIPLEMYLCEICENAVYFMIGLTSYITHGSQVPTYLHEIVEVFLAILNLLTV